MNALAPIIAHDRLDRVLAHTGHCLREIRHTDQAGALSGALALCWVRHLGAAERGMLLATAIQATEPETFGDYLAAAHRDLEVPGREMFSQVSRDHRPPTPTPVEKRRAAAINFDDTPRAILAAAWAGATDRDRRDLINRATGRVSA